MRAIAAPASLKEVLSAVAAADALAAGLRAGGAEANAVPVADGGEGTLDVLERALEHVERSLAAVGDRNRVRFRAAGAQPGRERVSGGDRRQDLFQARRSCDRSHRLPPRAPPPEIGRASCRERV